METAGYLSNMFLGCKLEQIDIGVSGLFKSNSPGRKRIHGSDGEKVKRHRERKRGNDIRLQNELYALNHGVGHPNAAAKIAGPDEPGTRLCNETTNEPFISDIVTGPAIGTLYSDRYSSKPLTYCTYYSDDDFIDLLVAFHKEIIGKKEERWLISPAIFDPDKCEGSDRGLGNIVYIRGIWLRLRRRRSNI